MIMDHLKKKDLMKTFFIDKLLGHTVASAVLCALGSVLIFTYVSYISLDAIKIDKHILTKSNKQ